MKDGTSPICPCYKCHKLFLIHPNSLVHDLLVCTGRDGELLLGLQLRKPNSFSHSEDRYKGDKWDNALLHSLSSVAMSRDMSIALHKFLVVIACAK